MTRNYSWFRLAKQQGQPFRECLARTLPRELRAWEKFWEVELACPERSEVYAAQTATEVSRLTSVTLQIATAKAGQSIDPNKVKLSDMLIRFDEPTKPAVPTTREEAARRSKSVWAARLGYKGVPK